MPSPLRFEVHPSTGVPIYRQLIDQITAMIAAGTLAAGDTLPSTRQMAADLAVNTMTVSKAYARLEADGILLRQRGLGMLVAATDKVPSATQRLTEVRPLLEPSIVRAIQVGMPEKEFKQLCQSIWKEFHQP